MAEIATAPKVNQSQASPPIAPYAPANLDDLRVEKEKTAERIKAKRPLLRKCLDPEFAAQNEARKQLFEYQVSCDYDRRNSKGKLESVSKTESVRAKDKAEAWAKFCDKIEAWPSPHMCERTIKKLKAA